MQLAANPDELQSLFVSALRRLAPGPGNWVTVNDLVNLQHFGFRSQYIDPQWTSLAAKLRVVHSVAQDCSERASQLEQLRAASRRLPFGDWHKRCFFQVLHEAEDSLRSCGVTRQGVILHLPRVGASVADFQKVAQTLIAKALSKPYYPEARLRQKMSKWKLDGVPGLLEREVQRNFTLFKTWCHPRVFACYYRALWNGWVTDGRMRSLRAAQSLEVRGCMLGCPSGQDDLDHYSICPCFWSFVAANRRGLGLRATKSRNAFFIVGGSAQPEERVLMAVGIYALYRTIQCRRHGHFNGDIDILLRRFAIHAARGSKASALFK